MVDTSVSQLGFFVIYLHAILSANFVDRRIYERDGGSLKKKQQGGHDVGAGR